MILYGMQNYALGDSSLVKRSRFTSFSVKGCDTSVFKFLCCVTLSLPQPRADVPEEVEIQLLEAPFIIAQQFDLGDNKFSDPVRRCMVFREYFKFTQYVLNVESLVAISFRSVDTVINLWSDPDDPTGRTYYKIYVE
jgi:hypothetical protein